MSDTNALLRIAAALEKLAKDGLGSSVPSGSESALRDGWFELSTGLGFRLDLVAVLVPLRPATTGAEAIWAPMVHLRNGQAFEIRDEADLERLKRALNERTTPPNLADHPNSNTKESK
jgi:hypothetical protein